MSVIKSLLIGLLVVLIYSSAAGAFFSGARAFFSDTAGHWANRWISVLAAKGVAHGLEPGRFAPDGEITRAQAAKLLVVALGQETDARELQGSNPRFGDLSGHWSAPYATVASEVGLFTGYEDGSFRPDSPITRVELAVVTLRALGVSGPAPAPAFVDQALIPAWARDQVAEAVGGGLVQGFPDGTFRPYGRAVRAEMAVLVSRVLKLRGDLFDLEGVIEAWDSGTVSIKIDGRSYRLAPAAVVRGPAGETDPAGFKPYYWVRGVLDRDGNLNYLEAALIAEIGRLAGLSGSRLEYRPISGPTDQVKSVELVSGAKVFRDGQKASVPDLRPGDRVFVVKDPRRPVSAVGLVAESPAGGAIGVEAAP